MMEIGLGVLKWSPDAFWGSNLTEFNAAVRGHNYTLGEKPALTVEDLEEMDQGADEFPDTVKSIKNNG